MSAIDALPEATPKKSTVGNEAILQGIDKKFSEGYTNQRHTYKNT